MQDGPVHLSVNEALPAAFFEFGLLQMSLVRHSEAGLVVVLHYLI